MFSESLYEGKGGAALKTSGESLAKESFAGEIVEKLLGKGYVRVSGEQVPLTDEGAEKAGEIYFLHKQVDRSSELLRP